MNFERKIAEEALEKPKGPSVEPTGEQKGGTLEIRGEVLVPSVSPHKDWRHVIAANFELRNNVRTLLYTDLGESEGIPLTLDFDLDYAYHLIRARGAPADSEVSFTVKKPGGVPEDQGAEVNGVIKTRSRVRICDVQIFYPQATKLNFSGDFVFGLYGHLPQKWTPEDLTLLLPSTEEAPNPVITGLTLGGGAGMPDFMRGLRERSLQQVLAPHQAPDFDTDNPVGPLTRGIATTDYLRFIYNEQTGKCLVVALSVGVVGDADPAETPPVAPTLPDTKPTENPNAFPWNPNDQGGPRLPTPDTEFSYTDENGDPLVAEPPPSGTGTAYALHADGYSFTENGGRTWDLRIMPTLGTLVDIAAGPGGVYLLNSAGKIRYGTGPLGAVAELSLADVFQSSENELPLINPGFETGDLLGWTHTFGDEPRVLDTMTPPQREGSTHYLSRDWRLVSAQDFNIQQTVDIPPSLVGETGKLRLYADVLTEKGDIGGVELLNGNETVIPSDNFIMTFSGGVFRADGFATSAFDGPLNLVGTPYEQNAPWGIPNAHPGIALLGLSNQQINGSIFWRVEKADGILFGGLVALRLFDLDNPNGTPESVDIQGVVSYNLLSSSVIAYNSGNELVKFTGSTSSVLGVDNPIARFHIVVQPVFGTTFRGEGQAGLGIKGPGVGAAAQPEILASESSSDSTWKRIVAEYDGVLPRRVIVQAYGVAVGGYADVFIDNIALTAPPASLDVKVGAMAAVRAKHTGGGVDLYVGDAVVDRRRGKTAEENRQSEEGPGDGITVFATPGEARVAAGGPIRRILANGTRCAAKALGGDWVDVELPSGQPASDVIAEPVAGFLTPVGSFYRFDFVLDALSPTPVLVGSGGTVVPDFRRSVGVVTGDAGSISFIEETGTGVWSPQPTASAAGRRTCCLDAGRYLGHSAGSYDLLWSDSPAEFNSWKVAGRLERPILKIVESR